MNEQKMVAADFQIKPRLVMGLVKKAKNNKQFLEQLTVQDDLEDLRWESISEEAEKVLE
jgi:hypothetical protein